MRARRVTGRLAALGLLLGLLSGLGHPVRAQEALGEARTFMEGLIGQHFTGKLNSFGVFPDLEFRGGTFVDEHWALRMDLGIALTANTRLRLGPTAGVWFSALWGSDLLGDSAGGDVRYLEGLSIGYGVIVGVEWTLSRRWTLVTEARLNQALATLGGTTYNVGGLTLLLGLGYR